MSFINKDYTLYFPGYLDLFGPKPTRKQKTKIKDVIFNPPATIIFWNDGTKTVVKQQAGDEWDAEKGFFAACAKKFFGNDGQMGFEVKAWVEPQTKTTDEGEEI